MAQSDSLWVVDRNSNLVNFKYVISLFIGADSNNAELYTVHANAFDPTAIFAGNNVAEFTINADGTGMTEADAVVLLQDFATLFGVVVFGPAVGAGY